jgi:hypothetical protein
VSGFLARKVQPHLGEHVRHEQLVRVLVVGFVLVPELDLAVLVPQVSEEAKMEKKTQWMVFG